MMIAVLTCETVTDICKFASAYEIDDQEEFLTVVLYGIGELKKCLN